MASERPADRGRILLLVASVVLLTLCVVTAIRKQDTLAGTLAVLGLGSLIIYVLMPRLTGPVELGPSGLKLQLVDAATKVGEAANYSTADIVTVVQKIIDGSGPQAKPSVEPANTSPAPAPAQAPPPPARRHPPAPPAPQPTGDNVPLEFDKSNMARALFEKFKTTADPEALRSAIEAAREALTLTPVDSSIWPQMASLLGQLLIADFQLKGQAEELDEVVSIFREALAATPPDSPHYAGLLRQLSQALMLRHERTGAFDDQEQVIALLQQLEAVRRANES